MIFQEQLRRSFYKNRDGIAIESGNKRLKYRELQGSSNQITNFLKKKVQANEFQIGVYLYDRTNIICAMIGVMQSRQVFIPLDSALPDNRIKSVIKDLNLDYVITTKDIMTNSCLNEFNSLECFLLEEIFAAEDTEIIEGEYPKCCTDDSLYIYFTSGSTGRPKGIIGKNSSLLQFIHWEIEEFDVDSSYRVSQFVSPYFDAFLRDVFVPLLAGGTICIPPSREDFFEESIISSWISESKINLIHCVPSVFRNFNREDLSKDEYRDLKYVFLSGEKVITSELKKWYQTFDNRIQLVNMYGTTETTMIRSFYRIQPTDVDQPKIPIGKPISDTEILISKDGIKPCGNLIPGEIFIATPYTTKGYLNSPELTHEKFRKVHSETLGTAISFKTGDFGRKTRNQIIELIGREDRQIKIRGIRVEIDEIESVLLQTNLVKQVLVVSRAEENESLVAFVIRKSEYQDNENLIESISRYLKNNLPEYSIPSKIIEKDKFPVLPNGKLDLNKILISLNETEFIKPQNKTEHRIFKIWEEVLGDKRISTNDTFHSLGGNSLSIMKLIGKFYKEFNVRISLNDFFNNPTIITQAKLINKSTKDNLLMITKCENRASYKLSSAQERIYYHYQIDTSSTSYNLPMVWKMSGKIDRDKIEKTINLLIQRHESLRTEFHIKNEGIRQEIKENASINLKSIPADDDNVDNLIQGFIQPFDLSKAPLFRCGIIENKENEIILVADSHHIVCDGMSQINLIQDFVAIYKGENPVQLPIQYRDYSDWENEFKTTEEYISNREFWLNSFEKEIQELEIPNRNLDNVTDEGDRIKFQIDKKTIETIHGQFEEDVAVFSVFYVIYNIYLAQISDQEDIIIGINSTGRLQDELQNLVGMFAKTLPIRHPLNMNAEFKDYVIDMHDFLIKAYSNQVYDYVDILKELHSRDNKKIESLFKTMLAFQNFKGFDFELPDLEISSYQFKQKTNNWAITLIISEEEEVFDFCFDYSTSYFTHQDVEILVEQFKSLVNRLAENSNKKISEFIISFDDSLSLNENLISFNL